jgi:hypothetical protein
MSKLQSKYMFAVVGLVFFGAQFTWIWLSGNPANSLHVSAQSYSFWMCAGLLAGVGFGAIAHLIPGFKPPEKPEATKDPATGG